MNEMTNTMPGIPQWLLAVSAAAILLLSFVLFEWLQRRQSVANIGGERYLRLDLLKFSPLKSMLKWRPFQFFMRLPFVLLFLFIIWAGLYGSQFPGGNIATLVTWTIWWAGIIFVVIFLGKFWCYFCPWLAIAEWVQRLTFWKRKNPALNLQREWPKAMRNIYIAAGFFVLLTWLDLGFGITMKPRATAYFALFMLLITVLPALIFEKGSFCRYACLVGRISGLYSLFAATELRSSDKGVCRACRTHDCYAGNEFGYPCPTSLNLAVTHLNTYCVLCTECVKTCPHDNVAINIRPFAADLRKTTHQRTDEAYLTLIMLALASFHGLSMTPVWSRATAWAQEWTNFSKLAIFSVGMGGIIMLLIAIYALFCWLIRLSAGTQVALTPGDGDSEIREITYKRLFVNFAYSLLPIALFYHLAHNAAHLFTEGQKVVTVASDPLGRGWDLMGTASLQLAPILTMTQIWYAQVALIVIGHVYGVYISHGIAYHTFPNSRQAFRSLIPNLLLMVAYSCFSLWLISLPMEMRTAM